MEDKNLNVFEIYELCVSTVVAHAKPCKVSPEVNEETQEYPCTLDMDQIQNIVLELNNEMTWSRRDKPERTLAYLDSGVADRKKKKFVMTQEETILSLRNDQYLNEFVVTGLVLKTKKNFITLENMMRI